MTLLLIILLAVGLSVDSFAVSLSCGLNHGASLGFRGYRFALTLAIMQGLMFFVGWLLSGLFISHSYQWDRYLAFAILLLLGVKMIYDSLRGLSEARECDCGYKSGDSLRALSFVRGLALGVATSIDAVGSGVALNIVGIEILEQGSSVMANFLVASAVISVTTFLFSLLGLFLGCRVSGVLSRWSGVVAGGILILIGLKSIF